MSTFPQWMATAAQAFSAWIESWVAQYFATFRARFREVSVQSCATIRGAMVRNPEGHNQPWLKVFVARPAVGSITRSPGDVLLVFQRPLCSLPVMAVATGLGMGELWLHYRRRRRVVPVAEGQRCMAVLATHGVGTHSIEGKKWHAQAEHFARDLWKHLALMVTKWDSYRTVHFRNRHQNFFRATRGRLARRSMEHYKRYWLHFGSRAGCQNFGAFSRATLKTAIFH